MKGRPGLCTRPPLPVSGLALEVDGDDGAVTGEVASLVKLDQLRIVQPDALIEVGAKRDHAAPELRALLEHPLRLFGLLELPLGTHEVNARACILQHLTFLAGALNFLAELRRCLLVALGDVDTALFVCAERYCGHLRHSSCCW